MSPPVSHPDVVNDLVANPFAEWEDSADPTIPSATLQIYQGIADRLGRNESGTNIDRASSATMCVRRRWYTAQGTQGKPLTPRKLVNFFMGDLAEKVLTHYIKECLVGPGKLYSEVDFGHPLGTHVFNGKTITLYEQPTLSWKISEAITVSAHPDGMGKRNLDGKWELIEIKSAAEYGFDDFKENGAGDYLRQAHASMMTAECKDRAVKEVRFYYLLKSTGHLWSRLHGFDPELAALVESEFILARGECVPERPFGPQPETFRGKPTGRTVLAWQCAYCPYNKTCFPARTVEWKKGRGFQKPVYVVPNA